MLIASTSLTNKTISLTQINLANTKADAIELRLESLEAFDFSAAKSVREKFYLPVIFSLPQSCSSQDILKCAELNPDYLSLDYRISKDFLRNIKNQYPAIKFIGAYINSDETPVDLFEILSNIQDLNFDFYKIVTYACNTLDALRLMRFAYSHPSQFPLTVAGTGPDGLITQILSQIVGNAMHYIDLEQLDELLKIYHFRELNKNSRIYALLGDPVQLSVGHILHNQAIRFLKKNAIYIKLRVEPHLLETVIDQCRQLPFAGFSVTMPLKESILSLVDQIDPDALPIQAINSITIEKEKLMGFNTDGLGAIQALITRSSKKLNLNHQKIVIIGAGGAARAIAYVARQQHAHVIILNRNLEKAKQLAGALNGDAYALDHKFNFKNLDYTIIINTLPEHVYADPVIKKIIKSEDLKPGIIAMDIVYQPIYTRFLQIAKQAQCICIPGYDMFIHQALLQIQKWFSADDNQLKEIKKIMTRYFNENYEF